MIFLQEILSRLYPYKSVFYKTETSRTLRPDRIQQSLFIKKDYFDIESPVHSPRVERRVIAPTKIQSDLESEDDSWVVGVGTEKDDVEPHVPSRALSNGG